MGIMPSTRWGNGWRRVAWGRSCSRDSHALRSMMTGQGTSSMHCVRPRRRLGGKRAAVAVGHKILVIVYHLLWQGTYYLTFRTLFSGSMKVFEECPLATCGIVL